MRKIFMLLCLVLLFSCKGSKNIDYKYTADETKQFLDHISRNIEITISDVTEIDKEPTDIFLISTRYPLSQEHLNIYNENGYITNSDDHISDFTTYVFKSYELMDEDNQKLQFVDDGRGIYLQEFGLWEYDNVLCQNLGIPVKLDKKFKNLKGYVTIEFIMPSIKKEVRIPVDISIYDELS